MLKQYMYMHTYLFVFLVEMPSTHGIPQMTGVCQTA